MLGKTVRSAKRDGAPGPLGPQMPWHPVVRSLGPGGRAEELVARCPGDPVARWGRRFRLRGLPRVRRGDPPQPRALGLGLGLGRCVQLYRGPPCYWAPRIRP